MKVCKNIREGFFSVPVSPPVRFEGGENCVFFGRAILDHFGRLLTVYVYKYMYMYLCICIYVYVYVFMYMYICICIYVLSLIHI